MRKISFVLLLFVFKCTENPFYDNQKIKGSSIVSGIVNLEGELDHSGILVWVEKYEIFTYSDTSGYYSLSIPKKADNNAGGFTDYIRLYFYVSNYNLESAAIFFFNGDLQTGTADIDENGEVAKVTLSNTLQIVTTAARQYLPDTSKIIIRTTTILRNYQSEVPTNAAMFLTPTETEGDPELQAFYIKSVSDEDFIYQKRGGTLITSPIRGFKVDEGVFIIDKEEFPAGVYEVFPFIIIEQALPVGLFEVFGPGADNFTANNLNVPIRQTKAIITID